MVASPAVSAQKARIGGRPLEPLIYRRMYLEHLHQHRIPPGRASAGQGSPGGPRRAGTRAGPAGARAGAVPRERDGRGIRGAPARHHVLFRRRRVRARDDYKSFAKKGLIQRILSAPGVRGDEFLGFGDGYVEIENMKEVGGGAVGVATAEPECQVVDEWKRQRLAGVGADFIVPNFLCHE